MSGALTLGASSVLTGRFHHHQRDPQVPRPPAAEPLVLHHVPRELTASWPRAPIPPPTDPTTVAPEPPPQWAPCSSWDLRSHFLWGVLAPHFPVTAVTRASIKSVLASARLLGSLSRARLVLPTRGGRGCMRTRGGSRRAHSPGGAPPTAGHRTHCTRESLHLRTKPKNQTPAVLGVSKGGATQ